MHKIKISLLTNNFMARMSVLKGLNLFVLNLNV